MAIFDHQAVTIELPSHTVQRLEQSAQQQRQTVAQLVRDLVLQVTTPLPALPPDLERELQAFELLSDETLWALARTVLTQRQLTRLAWLNEEAGARQLTEDEELERTALLDEYGRVLVRRATAAGLLKKRGHDLSDTAVLQNN